MTHTELHRGAAYSAGLAAAICMAICQIIGLIKGSDIAENLLYGLSLSSVAFGGTWAGAFFASLSRQPKDRAQTQQV